MNNQTGCPDSRPLPGDGTTVRPVVPHRFDGATFACGNPSPPIALIPESWFECA